MTALNILHTVEFYHPHVGGSESVVRSISEGLVERGHSVTVATTRDSARESPVLNGVAIVEFDLGGSAATGVWGPDADRYRRFLASFPADVMLNYAAQQWATDLAFEVMSEVAAERVNLIAPCGFSALRGHDEVRWPEYDEYYSTTIPALVPRYDAAIYHSRHYQDYEFARRRGFTNSVCIPNGVSAREFDQPAAIDFRSRYGVDTRHMGLCVANYLADKGQCTLIDAVREMARPDFTLVLIGFSGGHLDAVRSAAAGLNVKVLVDIPRSHTVAAFKSSDLFLFASTIEASPLVIIEAMAAKTPFVSTDCGNVREWPGGVVCEAGEIAAVAEKLLDDDGERARLGERGHQRWREQLTWEMISVTYEQLYLDLYRRKLLDGAAAESRDWRSDVAAVQRRIESKYADVSLYLRAALLMLRAGDRAAWRAYLEDALELDPDNPYADIWFRHGAAP